MGFWKQTDIFKTEMTEADFFLKQYKLKNTRQRNRVLDCFLQCGCAMSQPELEEELKQDMNRVTIYRVLKSFEEVDLLHRVFDDSGQLRYALAADVAHVGHAQDEQHAHFKCNKCQRLICLTNTSLPTIQVPNSYQMHSVYVLVQGICDNCKP